MKNEGTLRRISLTYLSITEGMGRARIVRNCSKHITGMMKAIYMHYLKLFYA